MKGFYVGEGYMGCVNGQYMLFADEADYMDYVGGAGVRACSSFKDGYSAKEARILLNFSFSLHWGKWQDFSNQINCLSDSRVSKYFLTSADDTWLSYRPSIKITGTSYFEQFSKSVCMSSCHRQRIACRLPFWRRYKSTGV